MSIIRFIFFLLLTAPLLVAGEDRTGERFHVFQRGTADVPGFAGQVRVHVGDIKRGARARIEVETRDGQSLATTYAAEYGDEITFEYQERVHVLKVRHYENHTLREDVAHLEIFPANGFILEVGAEQEKVDEHAPRDLQTATSDKPKPNRTLATERTKPYSFEVPPYEPPREGKACGTAQPTLSDRIADCASRNSELNVLGKQKTDEVIWQLVSRTQSGREVWYHVPSQKLWSDMLGREILDHTSFCRASGLSGYSLVRNLDCTPTEEGEDYYDLNISQSEPPQSWCVEKEGFVTPARFADSKGGMSRQSSATSPAVTWVLPSKDDWSMVEAHGAEKILPNHTSWLYWSDSSLTYHVKGLADKLLAARAGAEGDMPGFLIQQVRCVGTPIPDADASH